MGNAREEHPILLKIMLFLGLIGLVVAAYQTYEHYFLTSTICDFSTTLSCSAVTESRFGELPANSGIATAFWGLLWWIGFLFLTNKMRKRGTGNNRGFYMLLYNFAGLISVAYMILIEVYLLPMETGEVIICPFCTVQHLLIIALFIISFGLLTKPVREHFDDVFFTKDPDQDKRLNPKPVFLIVVFLLIAVPGYQILDRGGGQENHFEFTACLAEQGATMYGFDACPHCNQQKNMLGKEAFKKELEGEGYYVRCRPAEDAAKKLGERADSISSVEPLSPEDTQGEACEINVGSGTPTWVINGEKYVGEITMAEMSEATGCPLPEGVG